MITLLYIMFEYRRKYSSMVTVGLIMYGFYFAIISMLPVYLNDGRYGLLLAAAVAVTVRVAASVINVGIMSGVFIMNIFERIEKNGLLRADMTHNEYGTYLKEQREIREIMPVMKVICSLRAWSNYLLVTGAALLTYFPNVGTNEYMPEYIGYPAYEAGAVLIVTAIVLRVCALRKRVVLRGNSK